jgi:plasmid stabilization system protein ParE
MTRLVRILSRAQADVDRIYLWLRRRSPAGAAAWYAALLHTLHELGGNAAVYSIAPEAQSLCIDLQQTFFKTRRGRTYRLLFVVRAEEIRVLRVRGPGQRPVTPRDLPAE